MSGLLQLAWIQNRKTFLYLGVVLIILAYLLAAPIGPIKNGVLQMVQENAFLQKLLGAVIGLDLTGEMTLKLLVGGTWGHPFLIACMLGFGTICAARFPAQEIELDHIDLLMSGPASRGKVLTAHTLVGWGCLLVLHIVTLWAFWLGCLPLGSDAPEILDMLPLAGSLLAISIPVHAAATLLSTRTSSRGAVVGPLLAFLLWSLILAYVRPFVEFAQTLSPLGLLHYYRPGVIVQSGMEWQTIGGLVALSMAFYGLAYWSLIRRDLV